MAVYLNGAPVTPENVARFCKKAMEYKDVRPWKITLYQYPNTSKALDVLADICIANDAITTSARPRRKTKKSLPFYEKGEQEVYDAWHQDKQRRE